MGGPVSRLVIGRSDAGLEARSSRHSGATVEKEGSTCVADNDGDSDEARALRPLQAAACTYRIAFGPRAGQKVLTVQGAMPRETDFKQTLCADIDGFSLHAAVRCGADDRQALEQLCLKIAALTVRTCRLRLCGAQTRRMLPTSRTLFAAGGNKNARQQALDSGARAVQARPLKHLDFYGRLP